MKSCGYGCTLGSVRDRSQFAHYHYMSWFEDRITERESVREHCRVIDANAIPVYEAVWRQIMEVVEEAGASGIILCPGGSSEERYLTLARERLDYRLNSTERTISAAFGEQSVVLGLDVCDGGVVCMMHDGKRINERVAARLILDPFIFPELPPFVCEEESVYERRGMRSL